MATTSTLAFWTRVFVTHAGCQSQLFKESDNTMLSKRGSAPRNVPPPPRPKSSIPKPPSSHSAGSRFRGMITISESEDADCWVVGLRGFEDAGSVTLVMVPLVAEERDP